MQDLRTRARGSGFTLTEMIVAIAIVMILAAVLVPVLARTKESAKNAHSMSNVRQIAVATHMYADAADSKIPHCNDYEGAVDFIERVKVPNECAFTRTVILLDEPLLPLVRDRRVFDSPLSGPSRPGKYGLLHLGYQLNCRLVYRGYSLAALPIPADTTLANGTWEDLPANTINPLMNCGFADTHTKRIPRADCLAKWEPEPALR